MLRKGKIKRSKKPVQKTFIPFPKNYFSNTRNKWRGKIKKGIEQPIKNKFFEKRKNAIDTFGERKGLRVSKEISRLQKVAKQLSRNKPPKLKSTSIFKKK